MADNKIEIIASLDIPKSKHNIVGEIKQLQADLQADDNARPKLIAGLDIDKSKTLIQSQLDTFVTKANAPTIKVGIDVSSTNATQNIVSGLKGVQTQAQQTSDSIRNFGKNNTHIMETFRQSLANIGMNSTQIDAVADRINGLNVQIESLSQSMSKTTGKRGDKNILSVNIAGVDELGQAVKLTQQYDVVTGNLIRNIDAVSTAAQKENSQLENLHAQQIKRQSDLRNQISQIYNSAIDPNASRSITKTTHLDELQKRYNSINNAINDMGSSSKTVFAEQTANITSQITEIKNLITAYKRAENVSTALKPDKLANAISKAESQFESLNIKINNAGVSSKKLSDNIQIIQTVLDSPKKGNIIDKTSIEQAFTALRNANSELGALIKQKTSNSSVEKIRYQVSTLENQLNGFAEKNIGFSSFSKEINGAVISVESLKKELVGVKTSADLSVVTSKIKAFKDAFKDTQTEVLNVTKFIKDITAKIKQLDNNKLNSTFTRNNTNPEVVQQIAKIDELKAKYQNLLNLISQPQTPESLTKLRNETLLLDRDYQLLIQSVKNFQGTLRNDKTIDVNANKIKQLRAEIQAYMNLNPKAMNMKLSGGNTVGAELNRMLAQLNDLASPELVASIDRQFKTIGKTVVSMGKEGNTAFGSLLASAKKFGTWMGITGFISGFIRNIRKMITNVIELDTAMTNLKKVTDETTATYSKFFDSATERAKELGITIKDLVSATSEFAKLGYNLQDAQKLGEVASVYSNVGELDISDATASMVSTLAAFGIEAENAMSVIDKFNAVGKILPLYTVMYMSKSSYIG